MCWHWKVKNIVISTYGHYPLYQCLFALRVFFLWLWRTRCLLNSGQFALEGNLPMIKRMIPISLYYHTWHNHWIPLVDDFFIVIAQCQFLSPSCLGSFARASKDHFCPYICDSFTPEFIYFSPFFIFFALLEILHNFLFFALMHFDKSCPVLSHLGRMR